MRCPVEAGLCCMPYGPLQALPQTLSDPVRRSIYDELVGVAHTGLNPFLDGDADRNEVMPPGDILSWL
jgi:hypothetical protein